MFSVWEKQSFLKYDFAVIGGGIVGLNVALNIRKKYPKQKIILLERGFLPTGASTKNAGFACMGSPTEILSDLKKMTEQEVLQLFELRKKGLEKTRKLLGDTTIEYAENGSYELLQKEELYALDKVDYLNELLKPITEAPAYTIDNSISSKYGFNENFVLAAIKNNFEGELNTGKLMQALLQLCLQNNIEIRTGTTVNAIEDEGDKVRLIIGNALYNEPIHINIQQLFICTNAFTKSLLPNIDISPGRGQVLITKPIPNLKCKGIFHLSEGFFYFRELNNCILFGGGRNLDFEGETTTEIGKNSMIIADLEHKLKNIILPYTHFEIDYTWSGIMAFGANKKPIVQQHNKRIYLCVRMNGMGVAIGSELAEQIVELCEY